MAHPFVANSNILHRSFAAQPKRVVSASGASLFLESGQEVLDASAGPAVSVLGHGRAEVNQAILKQLETLPYLYSGARFTCDATEELASLLLAHRPGGLSKAIFVNSGSEATDAALKLATQYWHERGKPEKRFVIARKQSYHGNTIGALCVSGHRSRRAKYKDWLSSNVSFVDPCFAYRLKRAHESNDDYLRRLEWQLESEILRLGPENVSMFVAETVSGTTLGCLPPVPGYFKAVRRLCDKYDILLMLDEVSTSIGASATPCSLDLDLTSNGRLCAAWGKQAQCMPGNKRESPALTSKLLARHLEVALSPYRECCYTRAYLTRSPPEQEVWLMVTLSR